MTDDELVARFEDCTRAGIRHSKPCGASPLP